jgi:hypothetical protein
MNTQLHLTYTRPNANQNANVIHLGGPIAKPKADPLEQCRRAHERSLKAALRYLQKQPTNLHRKDALRTLALILETNTSSLAHRLIDLTPPDKRPLLREQLL